MHVKKITAFAGTKKQLYHIDKWLVNKEKSNAKSLGERTLLESITLVEVCSLLVELSFTHGLALTLQLASNCVFGASSDAFRMLWGVQKPPKQSPQLVQTD